MAMAIPSPSSSDDSLPPPTPTTQSDPSAPAPASSAGAIGKRKPSRRANTAERRATHNAVERQRRETLNGRFLDLAALLPNLSQIRRPSKSAIVNSSIAHIHASRRHRLLASRELRMLKHESDALRREINEWRDRAGIPRMEEPVRGDGFSMVLSGELEALVITGTNMEDDDDDLAGQYGMPSYEDDVEYHHAEMEDPRVALGHSASPPAQMSATPAVTPQMPTQRPSISIAHSSQHVGGPMIASPTAMSFENPAMGMYSEPHVSSSFPATYNYPTATVTHPHMSNLDAEKVAAWNMGMYQQQQMMMQQQQHRVVPQQHGPHPADQAYLASLHHQQRQRSASTASYHSAGGSPPHASAVSVSSGRSSGSASPAQGYDAYDGSNTWMMGSKQATQQVANGGNYGMMM